MIDKQTISYLRLAHGSYNITVMFLFIFQGTLGLRIRKGRKSGIKSFEIIKRHRKLGPILAFMGGIGSLAGLTLVYIDYGNLLKYPLHLITGSAIVFSITSTFLISRKIKGPESPFRTLHFRLGILILSLYLIQVFLGLGILL